jgi:hypothetical protein
MDAHDTLLLVEHGDDLVDCILATGSIVVVLG